MLVFFIVILGIFSAALSPFLSVEVVPVPFCSSDIQVKLHDVSNTLPFQAFWVGEKVIDTFAHWVRSDWCLFFLTGRTRTKQLSL